MLSAIPANEMAETLRVLAGDNAANAARYFGKYSFDNGDVATAILWTNVGQLLGPMLEAAPQADAPSGPPVPQRMKHLLEAAAFEGIRYEDVDSDALIRETLMELLEAEKPARTGEVHPFPERLQPIAAYTADGARAHAEPLPLAA